MGSERGFWAREVFRVRSNTRPRFRVIGTNTHCPFSVQIDGHEMRVIAVDGNPVETKNVRIFHVNPAERLEIGIRN